MTATPPGPPEPESLAVRIPRALWRLLTDRTYRHMQALRLLRPGNLFQLYNVTREDRYPLVFRAVAAELAGRPEIAVLSFGCATGEEVFTLRRYLPDAAIKGVDINRANIAVCNKKLGKLGDPRISFAVADRPDGEPSAHYDVIFCMAVLRDGRLRVTGATRCDHLIRFEDFARTIAQFERCLKPGGLLAVANSNFRVCDTPSAARLQPILQRPEAATRATPIFGPDNRLMKDVCYRDVLFRKTGD